MIFVVISANDLPRQTRLPPRNGLKVKGLRYPPLGLLAYGEVESKRSGIKESGKLHSLESRCIKNIKITKPISLTKLIPPIFVSLEKLDAPETDVGGSNLKDS